MMLRIPSEEQPLEHPIFSKSEIEVWVKRDDEIHPEISGNKFRKLKYHIEKVRASKHKKLLTFGGAFSNHIAATAYAGKAFGFNTIGIIRGEQPRQLSHTLQNAKNNGMKLIFTSREEYRQKDTPDFIESLRERLGSFHLVKEGGSDFLGVSGCLDISKEFTNHYDHIVLAAGTGTTACGVYLGTNSTHIHVISALKNGSFLLDDINRKQFEYTGTPIESERITLHTEYDFGGYAKINDELIDHARNFYTITGIKTDLVYTAKTTYALLELARKGAIEKGERVLFIHTGGLQGNEGLEQRKKFTLYKT